MSKFEKFAKHSEKHVKKEFPIYVSKSTLRKHVDLLLMEGKRQSHYGVMKNFQ